MENEEQEKIKIHQIRYAQKIITSRENVIYCNCCQIMPKGILFCNMIVHFIGKKLDIKR